MQKWILRVVVSIQPAEFAFAYCTYLFNCKINFYFQNKHETPLAKRIPELAINPLGDRIVHAFFRDGRSDVTHDYSSEKSGDRDVVNFCDFVRVLAHFRPITKIMETNELNSREEKLKC